MADFIPKDCPSCKNLGQIIDMGGDPADCPKCGGSGIDPQSLPPPRVDSIKIKFKRAKRT